MTEILIFKPLKKPINHIEIEKPKPLTGLHDPSHNFSPIHLMKSTISYIYGADHGPKQSLSTLPFAALTSWLNVGYTLPSSASVYYL